ADAMVAGQVLDVVSFVLGQLCVAHMQSLLAGKAVCYRIPAFFCYGKLHFKSESALYPVCSAGVYSFFLPEPAVGLV
ncbi:hypothetical protein, partial [Neisseria canis]|uniref:hypothetical protein n=1 Tax=Neisseria canis TaxID=493 RepID=UPI0027E15EDA